MSTTYERTDEEVIMRCPNCGKKVAMNVLLFNKVSKSKATMGLLTGGLSLFATGIKKKSRAYECKSCMNIFE